MNEHGMPLEWQDAIRPYISENDKAVLRQLNEFLKKERSMYNVFPPADKVYNALNLCPPSKVKVLIMGQDPYHERGQAMGLSFSVPKGVKIPPSLRNIYKEIQDEYGINYPKSGDLTNLANQGVLLLNAVLTVREGEANSHKNKGWEILTSAVVKSLRDSKKPMVYMLWGSDAGRLVENDSSNPQLVLRTTHPSPLSANRGFLGCGHFRKCNEYLEKNNLEPIDWRILL